MSNATFYKCRSKYGGMDAPMIARLKEIEDDNSRLKKMYAEERLKPELHQEVREKKSGNAPAAARYGQTASK